MNFAFSQNNKYLPFNNDSYFKLSDIEVSFIDQFLYRFTKLQDLIGQKIFKLILIIEDEFDEGHSMRDILDKMERFKVISSVDDWQNLREIRNEITHEYPLLESESIAALNFLFLKFPELFQILSNSMAIISKRIDIFVK
jgi:hypothetical protein